MSTNFRELELKEFASLCILHYWYKNPTNPLVGTATALAGTVVGAIGGLLFSPFIPLFSLPVIGLGFSIAGNDKFDFYESLSEDMHHPGTVTKLLVDGKTYEFYIFKKDSKWFVSREGKIDDETVTFYKITFKDLPEKNFIFRRV
jgi:hypothetical protein